MTTFSYSVFSMSDLSDIYFLGVFLYVFLCVCVVLEDIRPPGQKHLLFRILRVGGSGKGAITLTLTIVLVTGTNTSLFNMLDRILHLHATACCHQNHDERLAWVASWGQGTVFLNSFQLTTRDLTSFFLRLINCQVLLQEVILTFALKLN